MVASSYEIEILTHSFQSVTSEGQRAEMDQLRELCADLIEDIPQDKLERGPYYGEDGMDHHSLFVALGCVGEAVRRLNEAGYATDEDESDEEDEDEGITLYDGMFNEE